MRENEERKVPLGISNRHVHLSAEHLARLFGEESCLSNIRDLKQPGQFACGELVTLVGEKGSIGKVRVLGPVRPATQVEISVTDSYTLGVSPVVRDSGDLRETPGLRLAGPRGEVEIPEGVIVAARHVHLHTSEAAEFGVEDGDRLVLVTEDPVRPMEYRNVLVRVSDRYSEEVHLDVDEANAGLLKNGMMLRIRK